MSQYVLVCGGRNYAARDRVFRTLDEMHAQQRIAVLIHGGATGADTLAGEWAKAWQVHESVYPALWKTQGHAAGPIRNQFMLDESKPDVVIAFPGGKGTEDMVGRAMQAGVRVVMVSDE
jgi:YspA, cpYpsA-related SLOG family